MGDIEIQQEGEDCKKKFAALNHKVVLIGDGGVGKSALTLQLTNGHFVTNYDPTIEDAYRKTVSVDDIVCVLDILDTAGQEEFSAMRDNYFRLGGGFLIVYSVADKASFLSCTDFYSKILRVKNAEKFPIVIVANKTDVPAAERVVTATEGKEFSDQRGIPYVETSAKLRRNVEEAFYQIVREMRRLSGFVIEAKKAEECPRLSVTLEKKKKKKKLCILL